ncbi:Ltp family lipoprotein [Salinicoccus luteus]|uniref:Ltp family lipoprotein n=1 Tax=Salinicoccus luteus TaxID=367840 RepID=UPI000AE97EB0|nr:Ltp family lipoprotein [Salinicoccus luteus]
MKKYLFMIGMAAAILLSACGEEEVSSETADTDEMKIVQDENEALKERVSELEDELEAFDRTGDSETADAEVAELEEENEQLNNRVSELEEKLSSAEEQEEEVMALKEENETLESELVQAEEDLASAQEEYEDNTAEESTEAVLEEPAEKEAAEGDDVPREWESALNSAYSYAEIMHMSKAGIYDQLVSEYGENFPEEAAQYAIDNIEYDWKNNALESARSYQDLMDMSHAAIYDQLISDYGDKFTEEEAAYAVENLE